MTTPRILQLTRSGMIGTAVVIVLAALFVRLGLWQLERREWRLERNAAIEERSALPPLELSALPEDTAGLPFRRARVIGELDHANSLVWAGRSRRGVPGVNLITPLRLAAGGAILVNRGWLPSPDAATADIGPFRTPGRVELEGLLLPLGEPDPRRADTGASRTWFERTLGGAGRALPYPIPPLILLVLPEEEEREGEASPDARRPLDPSDQPAPGAPLPVDPPDLGEGPHLGYALQWFSFTVIALVGWLILMLRRERR